MRDKLRQDGRGQGPMRPSPGTQPGQQSLGCDVCRGELEAFLKPHLENIFAGALPRGDLSGIGRRVMESPSQLMEVDGHVTYQNDFVYECKECHALWLQQYWEVETPETTFREFGHRYVRVLPISSSQVEDIWAAIRSARKLSHDEFV